jgi:hypothetical protein
MRYHRWLGALGLGLAVSLAARAEITDGVMAVRGAEMS